MSDEIDRATAPDRRWVALVAELPDSAEDEFVGRLTAFAAGAERLPADRPGWGTIKACLRSPSDAEAALERAAGVLAELGVGESAASLRIEVIEDERWVERYQASLQPFPLGSRFVVQPGGTAPPASTRIALRLVPGRAFGTGEHATTRLSVEQLERRVQRGSSWLDVGCGSGILSLVAHHCGAGSILAVDVDAEAVAVARDVFVANGLGGRVEIRHGALGDDVGSDWNGVVANIHVSFFASQSADLRDCLRPGGLLIASGFVADDLPEVREALAAAGLAGVAEDVAPPWGVLVARRE